MMDDATVRHLYDLVQSCINDCGAMQDFWYEDECAITENELPLITEIMNHFDDLTEKLSDVRKALRNAVIEQKKG